MLHHLPNFEVALPRLVANSEVSFSIPFVPQPLHRGIAPGADWVLGGGIFGQILAASTILFLPGCFIKEEVLGTSIKNSDSYITENTILSFLSSYPIASDKLHFQIIFIRTTSYQLEMIRDLFKYWVLSTWTCISYEGELGCSSHKWQKNLPLNICVKETKFHVPHTTKKQCIVTVLPWKGECISWV